MTVASLPRSAPPGFGRVACAVACLLVISGSGVRAEEMATATVPAPEGRISALSGTVSVHATGQERWSAAVVERKLASGEGLWTQPGAQASVMLGAAALELPEQTQIEITNLSAVDTEFRLVQGALGLSVPKLGRGVPI